MSMEKAISRALADMVGRESKGYDPTIDRSGDKVILPDNAYIPDVISALQRKFENEEQETIVHSVFGCSPWDGAHSLMRAVKEVLGIVVETGDFFGNSHSVETEIEYGKTIKVPWGGFNLTGMEDATAQMDTVHKDGVYVFECRIKCKRKYQERAQKILDRARELCVLEPLHKGKAFSIKFRDENGEREVLPEPKFFRMSEEVPIFRRDLENAIDRNVFTPIRYADKMLEAGESLKRGVMFAGDYGVGKTLLSSYIAREATANGWTFIYVKDSAELPMALHYAQQYQPVVVFAEDVDQVAGENRTKDVNKLLNQLDGIDSKSAKIITILTSNHPDKLNAAMRRPGRIDMIIPVLPPDAEAVHRMLWEFSKGAIQPSADLSEVSVVLAGETPARVREVLNRGKLEAMRRSMGDTTEGLTGEDLYHVAVEVMEEKKLFQPRKPIANYDISVADGLVAAGQAMKNSINGVAATR